MASSRTTSGIADNRFGQDRSGQDGRRGVRRTVTVLTVVVGAFYLLSFVQILLMR